LKLNDCGQGNILKSYDGGWSCVTEDDPTVNSLGKAAAMEPGVGGCSSSGSIAVTDGTEWTCSDIANWETDPSVNSLAKSTGPNGCGQGQVPIQGDGGWGCATVTGQETDPQVGTLVATRWCTANDAGAVECQATAPVLTETDPQVGTIIATRWCTANDAGNVECQAAAPTETDPQVSTLVATRWCTANDAGAVECQASSPVLVETDPTAVHLTGDETVAGLKTFSSDVTLTDDLAFATQDLATIGFTPAQSASVGATGSPMTVTGQTGGDQSGIGGLLAVSAGTGGRGYLSTAGGAGGVLYLQGGPGGGNSGSGLAGKGGAVLLYGGEAGTSTSDVSGGDVWVYGGYANDDAASGGVVYLGARPTGSPLAPSYSKRQTDSVQTWATFHALANMTVGNTASEHIIGSVARGTVDVGTFGCANPMAVGSCCYGSMALTNNSFYGSGHVVACSGYGLSLGYATICTQQSAFSVYVQVCRLGGAANTPSGTVNAVIFN
jgi:hypothetical protein